MASLLRALGAGVPLVAAPAAASAWSATVASGPLAASRSRELDFAEWVVALAAVALAAVLAWLAVTAGAGVAAAVARLRRSSNGGNGGRRNGRAPLPSHRSAVAAAVTAVVLLAAGAGTAAAAQAPRSVAARSWQVNEPIGSSIVAPASAVTVSPAAVAGWTPQVSTVAPATAELVVGQPAGGAEAPHVVVRGDSLWSIAAQQLGPDASASEIAAHWPRWWQANLDVIGPDPDLILPGQQLRPPS